MSVIEKLASEGNLTEEEVERIGRSVADFMDAVRKDPSLRKEAMEKLAIGLPSFLRDPSLRQGFMQKAMGHAWDIAPMAAGAAVLGGAFGLARKIGETGVGAARDKIEKARAYKTMIEENPHLQNVDPSVSQKAFNTLYRFNPQYAADPLVAGTFVRNVADQERLDIGTVNSLVQARRNLADRGNAPDYVATAQGMGKAIGEHQKALGASEKRERDAELARARQAEQNVNVLGAQERLRQAEKAYEAEEAKRKFWGEAEAVSPDDPRAQ